MKLLRSIRLEEMSLVDLGAMINGLIDELGDNPKIFWHSERFKTECYLCIYMESKDDSSSP